MSGSIASLILFWTVVALLTGPALFGVYKLIQAIDKWATERAHVGRWTVPWLIGSISMFAILASVIGYAVL